MRRLILALLALLLLAACQNRDETPSPEDEAAAVLFHRSGGVAGEDTTWRFFPEGRVTVTDEVEGTTEEVAVDAAQVDELVADLRTAAFFEHTGNYVPEDSCCDHFFYTLTVRDGDEEGTIETIDTTVGVPIEALTSIGLVEAFIFNEVEGGR